MIRIGSVRLKRHVANFLSPEQHVVVHENGQDRAAWFVYSAASLDRETYTFRREA
jgi:hypothetical protein